jgi:ribonucleoside-diphosphate reductase alpha chain
MKKLAPKAEVSAGLKVERYFTHKGKHPFDEIEWETRTAEIKDFKTGKSSFKQEDLEFPQFWSQRATDIVASKYFRGLMGTPRREYSVKQLIGRIVDTLTGWGGKMKYFASKEDAQAFNHELTHLLLHQMAAFNSSLWVSRKNPSVPPVLSTASKTTWLPS